MTYPRLAALSKVVQTSKDDSIWTDCKDKLPVLMQHISAMGNKCDAGSQPVSHWMLELSKVLVAVPQLVDLYWSYAERAAV